MSTFLLAVPSGTSTEYLWWADDTIPFSWENREDRKSLSKIINATINPYWAEYFTTCLTLPVFALSVSPLPAKDEDGLVSTIMYGKVQGAIEKFTDYMSGDNTFHTQMHRLLTHVHDHMDDEYFLKLRVFFKEHADDHIHTVSLPYSRTSFAAGTVTTMQAVYDEVTDIKNFYEYRQLRSPKK
jgi:hypothetical protein